MSRKRISEMDAIKRGAYSANRQGEIFSYKRGVCRKLSPTLNRTGYVSAGLCVGGVQVRFYVHRFVWVYFKGDIPEGLQVNHIDFDKSNNALDNLELVSPKMNSQHRALRKTSSRIYTKKFSDELVKEIRDRLDEGYSYLALAKAYGCGESTIKRIGWASYGKKK